jgi:hypothetical protein
MRVSQRGRAILRRMSADEGQEVRDTGDSTSRVQTYRPGDFLLTSSNGGLALLLGYATASKINHAAVIVDSQGTLIEASPSLIRHDQAYRVSNIQRYLESGRPCWIGYVEVREGSRQEVADYAEHLWRASRTTHLSGRFWLVLHMLFSIAPRSYTALLGTSPAFRHFFEHRAVVIREDLCYSSGELVARALERGGFIWEHDPAQVTPADIFRRYRQPESVPATTPLKQPRVAHESLVGVRTTSGGPFSSGFLSLVAHQSVKTSDPETTTADSRKPETTWQILLGVGVVTMVGLACVGFIEQLARSLTRKA